MPSALQLLLLTEFPRLRDLERSSIVQILLDRLKSDRCPRINPVPGTLTYTKRCDIMSIVWVRDWMKRFPTPTREQRDQLRNGIHT